MKRRTTKRRGMELGALPAVGLTFILIAIIFGLGGYILAEMNADISDTNATAIINEGTSALMDLSGWLPIIGIVVAAGVIIGIIVTVFSRRKGGM